MAPQQQPTAAGLPEAGDFLASLGWSDGTEDRAGGNSGGLGGGRSGALAFDSRPWPGC